MSRRREYTLRISFFIAIRDIYSTLLATLYLVSEDLVSRSPCTYPRRVVKTLEQLLYMQLLTSFLSPPRTTELRIAVAPCVLFLEHVARSTWQLVTWLAIVN